MPYPTAGRDWYRDPNQKPRPNVGTADDQSASTFGQRFSFTPIWYRRPTVPGLHLGMRPETMMPNSPGTTTGPGLDLKPILLIAAALLAIFWFTK